MYRRIKKILIVPLLIVTVLSCMLYTDYRKPMEVQAVVLTGDPFADLFGWALELVGFTGKNKESQDQALHNFVQYISKEINELKSNTQAWTDNKILNTSAYETWKNSMAKKWSSMSEKERFMNCLNTYTEAEYRKSGTTDSYYAWLNETYVKSSTNPFEDVSECVPLNLLIAAAIRDGKISSKYTAEQWEQSGTFAILTMAVKDWLTGISKEVLEDAEAIWEATLGQVVNTANIKSYLWYKFLNDDFDSIVSILSFPTYEYGDLSEKIRNFLIESKDNFLNLISSQSSDSLKLGSKYFLEVQVYAYYSIVQDVHFSFVDIPDNCTQIKYVNKNSNLFFECYDSENVLNSFSNINCYYRSYRDTNGSLVLSKSGKYSKYVPYNFLRSNLLRYANGDSTYYSIYIPFGLNNVSISEDSDTLSSSSYDVTVLDRDENEEIYLPTPFDVVKTGNGDLAADIAGTMIDVSDVQDIPTDEVIDLDVTETGVAAREQEDTDALDKAKDNAQTRQEEEAKPDVNDDVNSKDDDLDKYKIKVTDIFPFCIPFDIYRFFSCLAADPVAPSFTIPLIVENSFGIPEYSVEIDFSKFDSVAAILRKMELLGFCVGLAFVTNKLIKH